MAGSQAVVVLSQGEAEMPVAAIREQWTIHFSRFISYPNVTSKNSVLHPLQSCIRNRRPQGTWLSLSSPAFLQLRHICSTPDLIFSVRFRDKILEEHYLSTLHFSWPQVSCVSGFPSRGTRTIFGSYRDSAGEVQKFALRFSTTNETGLFVNILKEMCKDARDIDPLSTDIGSKISTQSELFSSNRPSDVSNNPCKELSNSIVQPYSPQMPLGLNDKVEMYSCSQEKEPHQHLENIFTNIPPSFTSLLSSCSEVNQGVTAVQPSAADDNDLESQIMKCMEDSSFQDILNRVEKIVNEMGR